jgi:hypothetical protein
MTPLNSFMVASPFCLNETQSKGKRVNAGNVTPLA